MHEMISGDRSYEGYMSNTAHPQQLVPFQAIKKQHNYYPYNVYSEHYDYTPEDNQELISQYHQLCTTNENYFSEPWRHTDVEDWTSRDATQWLTETLVLHPESNDLQIALAKLGHYSGEELLKLDKETMRGIMYNDYMDYEKSNKIADYIYDSLPGRKCTAQIHTQPQKTNGTPMYTVDNQGSYIDLDSSSLETRNRQSDAFLTEAFYSGPCESEDERKDTVFLDTVLENASTSGTSDTFDLESKHETGRKKPGRPKGSSKRQDRKIKNVSVPEFIKQLLLNPAYCPSLIKWETYELKKFKFVQPAQVAKLWGKKKQNENMSFDKFSRAMRYHYRNSVLLSVGNARLVYQFGPNGPKFPTDNPIYEKKNARSKM